MFTQRICECCPYKHQDFQPSDIVLFYLSMVTSQFCFSSQRSSLSKPLGITCHIKLFMFSVIVIHRLSSASKQSPLMSHPVWPFSIPIIAKIEKEISRWPYTARVNARIYRLGRDLIWHLRVKPDRSSTIWAICYRTQFYLPRTLENCSRELKTYPWGWVMFRLYFRIILRATWTESFTLILQFQF